jgi:hypothetical protein
MAVFRIVGEEMVTEADFRGRIAEQAAALEATSAEVVLEEVTPFTPIGIGKPLTIQIRHVYTGKYPKSGGLFGSSKDVAVVSGVRDYSVFAATARALNFIQRNHKARLPLKTPSAFADGTPVVAYYPALTVDSLTLSVEIAIDDFPQDFVNSLGGAFQTLGGIPLLLPHAGFLLGAGEILKLAGGIGNALFDGKPEFSITEPLNFDVPGSLVPTADFRLLTHSATLPIDYRYDDAQGLVRKDNGQRYDGDDPYVVVSLDGKERPNLADFAATAASASILKRFFNIGDDVRTPIDTVVEGIKLASDMRFRDKALETKKALDKLAADSPDRAKLQLQYDALVKNIANDLFKPKTDG